MLIQLHMLLGGNAGPDRPQASTVGKVQVRAVALGRLLSPVAMHSSLSLSLSESTSHPASESMSIAQVGDGIGDGSGDDLRAANALEANAFGVGLGVANGTLVPSRFRSAGLSSS